MTDVCIRYLHRIRKPNGRVYWYFRLGDRRAPLPPPGTPGFHAAYEAARAAPVETPRAAPGTFAALGASWYRSNRFTSLAPQSQRTYRRLMEGFLAEYGELRVATLRPMHVHRIIEIRSGTPAQGNALLNVLKLALQHAVKTELIQENPARAVERLRYEKRPHPTWSEEDIAAFEARWPVGSRARLALALLVYTGQRRSDVIRMGSQDVRGGWLHVRQQKTKRELDIPVHVELAEILAACPAGHLAFLVTEAGRPFASGNAFYNWFVDCARKAGIAAGLSPHGLRKATVCRLMEAGCTAPAIASITGQSLRMVEHNAREVNQKRLAAAAIAHLGRPERQP